ncbi:O-linked N-acetylglucosamine transferase family protein [Roseateles sp. 22389]|uniref:O-linked N-acetylglucosamine transferase, SPINDLY family protein n=1 Tax=Roseateles sp. 22389 TaxID=3453916 RepID=UPI003F87081E
MSASKGQLEQPRGPATLARAHALADRGDWIAAEAEYRALAQAAGAGAALLYNWGIALRETGRIEDAIAAFEQAASRDPAYARAFHGLSLSYRDLGARDAALMAIELAIDADPACDDFRFERAEQLIDADRWRDALPALAVIGPEAPGHAVARNLMGMALRQGGREAEALDAFSTAIRHDPAFAAPLQNRANLHLRARRFTLAVDDFDAALRLTPHAPWLAGLRLYAAMHVYDWRDFDARRDALLNQVARGEAVAQPLVVQNLTDDPALQQAAARTWARHASPRAATPPMRPGFPAGRKIRIAYVSRDFHAHPVAFLLAETLELHDREVFDVALINHGEARDDPMQQRLRAAADAFLDVGGWSDERVAALCRELSIDIAVDLTGHTEGGRVALFAGRVAPVQMLYLGYLGTSGSGAYDYLVADPRLIDADTRACFHERLLVLPCYQANDRQRPRPAAADRRALGLPPDAVVLCCFNNPAKLTPAMFRTWGRILSRVPHAVLWLLAEEDEAIHRLRREAAAIGLAPERLVFARRCAREDYLARLAAADLFLDTLPYNAGTTASDALWMGLPVLTQRGRAFAGRMAASLLHAVGLPELIVETTEDYVERAVALAAAPEPLAALRDRLRAQRDTAPLFDTPAFTRSLELGYLAALSGSVDGDIVID